MVAESIENKKIKGGFSLKKKFIAILRLLRVKQYYKNVVIFTGVFFGGKLFDFSIYPQLILGFILISLLSSMNYIQNDIHDKEEDKIHPEKAKKRPLASGDLSVTTALIIFGLLAIIELYALHYYIKIHNAFAIYLFLIYFTGQLYNYILKNHAFTDILSLSSIYVWRALAGCSIVSIQISPWLYIVVFLTALFLAAGKRSADLQLLGEENATKHKKVYDKYSQRLLDSLVNLIATSLFIIYTMYCILGPKEPSSWIAQDNQYMLTYTIPFALYLIIRYMYLIQAQPEIARRSELALKDKGMIIGALLLVVLILITLYFGSGSLQFLHLEELFN